MSELFVWEGEIDWIVAESEKEALSICREYYGGNLDDDELGEFIKCPMEQELKIHDDKCEIVTKTVAEWIECHGKGFLCSTEW